LLWRFGWDNSEQWTWILSFTVPLLISLFYVLIKEKTINPLELLENSKDKIKKIKYKQFNFDSSKLKELKSERKELKNEIQELKSLHTT
jgi:Tfp pilus assembly protein PilO